MPTAVLKYEIKQSVTGSTQFAVDVHIIDARFIDPALFVFDTKYQAYTNVATLHDMLTWPAAQATAAASGLDFFRAAGVLRTFTNITDAITFATITAGRIEALRKDWQTYLDSFAADTITTTPTGA